MLSDFYKYLCKLVTRKYSTNIKIFFVVVVGICLSFFVFQSMNNKSQNEAGQQFILIANEQLLSLEKNIEKELIALKSVVALFGASEKVTREEFSLFINRLSKDKGVVSFHAIEWIPRVTSVQRNNYESLARNDGFEDFSIKELTIDGTIVNAKLRDEYFPVYYVEPYKGNELALGFDLTSNSVRKKALEKARDTGVMVASSKINLVQVKEDNVGVLTFYPVYEKGKPHNSIELRREYLKGFALGVIKVKSLISGTFKSNKNILLGSMGVDFFIYDLNDSLQVPLFIHQYKTRKNNTSSISLDEVKNSIFVEKKFIIGDREWLIVAKPHKSNISYQIPFQNWIVFFSCMLVVIVMSAYMFVSSKGARSIAERNKAKHALMLSEKRLNEAQRIAKVGSWELEIEENRLIWSDEIFRIFEVDKNIFSASYDVFLNAVHPEDRDMVRQSYSNSLENRQPYEIVHRLQMSNGSIKYVREICESFFDKDKPVLSIGTVQDITEIKVAENELSKHRNNLEELVAERTQELADAQEELVRKERLATLGQLTATVSHELRNPLGAMRPSLFILEKKSDKGDEHLQKAIERIDRNIDRCDHIIDELLDFTRITELDKTSVRVDKWIDNVIEEQVIPEGISIVKNLYLKGFLLDVDVDRLRRAIINVIENACHAMMDDNQKIVKDDNAQINIKTSLNDKRAEISIADTGVGIPKDIVEKIFEPLFSTKTFGVGLGMPTIKQIMEQHNGGIEIDSEEDKGTTIILWLPLEKNEQRVKEVEV